jgi:hypothetical protein
VTRPRCAEWTVNASAWYTRALLGEGAEEGLRSMAKLASTAPERLAGRSGSEGQRVKAADHVWDG